MTRNEAIEIFHYQFLRLLSNDPNKAFYTIKGGQNLRFFFKSVRHSDDLDLDLDVAVTSKQTLRKKIDKILSSPVLSKSLALHGISAKVIPSKQTDTTQRWKLELKVHGLHEPLATRIEFSRRDSAEDLSKHAEVGLIDEAVSTKYKMARIAVSHYKLTRSIVQKVRALAGRCAPRDVFDLAVLLEQYGADLGPFVPLPELANVAAKALEQAQGMTYDMYLSQVIPYIEKDKQQEYKSRRKWEEMKLAVAQALEMMS